MKRFLAVFLALALFCSSFALAGEAPLERTPSERELDALVDAYLRTKDLPASLGAWEEGNWYQEWLKEYDLAGNYHPSADYGEPAEEQAICDVAYEAWVKLCGIGNDNDFSLASEAYLLDHELNGVTRQMWLVIRVHDDMMPDFFMLIDRSGKWRINTMLKGFATGLCGLASSFSSTGDIIMIGKDKEDMLRAFNRMKEIGGGIVIFEEGRLVCELPLALKGIMSSLPLKELIAQEKKLFATLKDRGYQFEDPIYSLLFFCSTHLPYIRVTQQGFYDVMKKTVLFPTIMR